MTVASFVFVETPQPSEGCRNILGVHRVRKPARAPLYYFTIISVFVCVCAYKTWKKVRPHCKVTEENYHLPFLTSQGLLAGGCEFPPGSEWFPFIIMLVVGV